MKLLSQNKTIVVLILLIVFSIPAIFPLFHQGFFQSDDGEWMVIRFSAFYQALKDGQIPVRWLPRLNFQYGYPVADFLYPGFMYLGIPLKLLGFGFVGTIKIILGFSFVGSGVFTYLWLARLFNRFSAFIGALFYVYAPYHLYDLYKRGSVGEILALAVVPFIFWQIERNSFFWTCLGIGLLVLAHNTLTLLFSPLIIIYIILKWYQTKNIRLIYQYTSILVIGIGLSAFFWIPALYDLQYTVFSKTQISDFQNYFANINLIGWPTLAVFVGSILLSVFYKKTKKINQKLIVLFLIFGLVSLILSSSISSFLWNNLAASFVQFPFRFLSISILSFAFLTAFIIAFLKAEKARLAGITVVFILAVSSLPYVQPPVFFDKGDDFYATNVDTTTVKNEYMPKWVKENPKQIPTGLISGKNIQVNVKLNKSNHILIQTNSARNNVFAINQTYFPGWSVTVDNQPVNINYNNKYGTMNINIPSGSHTIDTQFIETPIRVVSDMISIVSLVVLCIVSLNKSKLKMINNR